MEKATIDIATNLKPFFTALEGTPCKLVAVSKTKPNELILAAYQAGQVIFGENKVQDMTDKHEALPKDIHWHMIGHLQTNKVKYIAPYVSMIHAVDSMKLLKEINKRAKGCDRVIKCLFQIHIAAEETKFGLSREELDELIGSETFQSLTHIDMVGVMGMATNTDDQDQIRREFKGLKALFEDTKAKVGDTANLHFSEVSMGMSGDWQIAVEEGSTMIRIGSSIFGDRASA